MYADEEDDESYFDYEGEGFPSLATRNSGYGGTTRIVPKVPPTFDGTTSWLEYEDMIEDWLGNHQPVAGEVGTLSEECAGRPGRVLQEHARQPEAPG